MLHHVFVNLTEWRKRETRVYVGSKVCVRLNHANLEGFLCFADPVTRVVELFVGLIWPLGIADLTLQILSVFRLKRANSIPIRPLGIGIDVHFDDPVVDGGLNFVLLGTGAPTIVIGKALVLCPVHGWDLVRNINARVGPVGTTYTV